MNDKQKTKAQLIQELNDARECAAQLETRVQHLEKLLNEQFASLPSSNKRFEHEITGPVCDTRLQTFSNIVEQSGESIIVTNLEGRITYINPAAEHLFGYRLEEVIGKDPIIFNAEPDPVASHNEMTETVRRGDKTTREILIRRKDGSVLCASLSISPMCDENGAIYGFIGLHQDITERKHAEKLTIAERDLSMALNNTTTLTEALKICLDAAIELSEIDSGGIYLRNESTGDFDLVVHKGLSEAFVSGVSRFRRESPGIRMVMEGKPVYFNYEKYESPVKKIAGDEGLKATAVLPVLYKNQVLGCLNIGSHSLGEMPKLARIGLETITSHIGAAIVHARQAELIRHSRENYDLLFNTVQDFIVITDNKGDIIHANEITYKQLGYTKEDLLGQPVLMLHPKETHDAAITRIQAMLAGEEDTCMIPLEAKDGTHIPVETKVWHGRWDGQEVVFGISRDVTARNQFEAALQESRDELASVLDNAPVPIATFDGERFLYLSKAWYDFTGQKRTELPGIDFWVNRIHPDDMEKTLAVWENIYHTKRDTVLYFRLKNHSDEYRDIECRAVPVFDRGGQFKYFLGYNIDITERKLAEEKLRESQQRLDLAVRGARVGLWDWSVQTGEIIINERWAEIIGYTLSELVPADFKKWAELCHPDDLKKSNDALARHFAGKDDYYECEVRLKHKNGEWVWILDQGKVFEWNENGKPTRMTGTHLDITDRKRANEALRESEELYRSTLKASPDSIAIYDMEGTIRVVSPTKLKMLGYTREEDVIGHSILEFVHPKDHERVLSDIGNILQGIPIGLNEYSALHANGRALPVESNAEVIRNAAGNPTGIVVITRDITERKRAEEALQQSERNYREIFNATSDAIILHDAATGDLLDVNDALVRMHGYDSKEEALRANIRDLSADDPNTVEEAQRNMRLAVEKGPQVFEWRSKKKNGDLFWVEVFLQSTQIGGEGRFLAVARDITGRKRAEEALQQSERNYREIFNATTEAIFLQDAVTGRVLDVNDTMLRMFGYDSKEDVLSRNISDLSTNEPPYAQEEAIRRIRLAVEEGPQVFEWLSKKKNGDLFWAEVSLQSTQIGGEGCILAVARDITERKRVEEALQESERNYREIFNATSDGIVLHDAATGQMLDANDAMVRMHGYDSKEEVMRATIGDFSSNRPPYTGVNALRRMRLAVEEGPQVFDWLAKKKNGDLFWVEVSIRGIQMRGEGRILVALRDITERKLAEEALRESEERFKLIFYTNPEAVVISTLQDGLLVDVNHSVTRLTGYTREDAVGKTSAEISLLANAEDREELIRRLKETGYCENLEIGFRRKDGSIGTGLLSASMMSLKGVPHIVSITRDITELKQAEEEIRKLSEVVEQSPVSVVITGTDGSISYVNPKFSEVTGYALEEVKGKKPSILKSGETSAEEYKVLWDTITSGHVWQGQFRNRKKDGGMFWEDATISPFFDENGRITHFVAIKEDITPRMVLEQQLRQSQKMEAIGRLAGGVAHDFNNLLLVIKGFSDLMRRRMTSGDPHYDHILQIQRASERAAELTRQLLAFSRKQILQPKVLDLNALLKDMEKMLRRIIGEDIDLVTIYEGDLYNVKADPGQIEQVILNLAVNARDAMPDGGKLTIECRNAYLDEAYVKAHEGSAVGHYAMISISDTGYGIDKEAQAHIFEPFFTTKELGKGTGLGLSTVYGIIKQSGGNIWLYSEPGMGTTFRIYLPSLEDTAGEVPKQYSKSKKAIRGTETILIVEDEDIVREMLVVGLEDLGYKICKARNGADALEVIDSCSKEIQLLLTDVVMPKMSGRQLANKVSGRMPKIKILFMSGYTDSEIVHHGMLDEGVAFIQKPFSMPEIAKKIRELLDENKGPQP